MKSNSNAYITGLNLLLMRDSAHIISILQSAGVQPIVVKGLSLIATVYGESIHERPMADVDLFIKPAHFKKTTRILVNLGFSRQPGGEPHYTRKPSRDSAALILDLHVGLPYLSGNAFKRLWESARIIPISGTTCLMLSEIDEFVYLVYHSAVHHGGYDEKWMRDLDLVTRRNMTKGFDWSRAVSRLRKYNLGLPAAVMLHRLREHFGTPIPRGIIKKLWPKGLNSLEARAYRYMTRGKSVFEFGHVLKFFINRGFDRLFFFGRYMFPSPEFVTQRYGTKGFIQTASAMVSRPFKGFAKFSRLASKALKTS